MSSSSSSTSSSSISSSSSSISSSSTSLVIPSLKHFWYTLRDSQGVTRDGELVYIYEAGTTKPLNIYNNIGLSASNPITTSTGTSAASSTGGVFEFYLKDLMWNNESPSGYAWDDRIKIQWDQGGTAKYSDRIMTWGDFYPVYTIEGITTPREAAFDPLDFSLITPPVSSDADYNDKNKAVSNSLVCKIGSHIVTSLVDFLSSSSLSSSSSSSSSSVSSSSSSSSLSSSSTSSSSSSSSSSLSSSSSSSSSSLSSSSSSSSLSSSSSSSLSSSSSSSSSSLSSSSSSSSLSSSSSSSSLSSSSSSSSLSSSSSSSSSSLSSSSSSLSSSSSSSSSSLSSSSSSSSLSSSSSSSSLSSSSSSLSSSSSSLSSSSSSSSLSSSSLSSSSLSSSSLSSSSRSSSSSSSSLSSSSISSSSSSNSDASFMGAGWPYGTDEIQVVIGSRWITTYLTFTEDDIITLKRVDEEQDGPSIWYTENGTIVGNPVVNSPYTNRLKIEIKQAGASFIKLLWGRGHNQLAFGDIAYVDNIANVPYDFKSFWDTSPSFNTYALTSFFDVNTTSSFTPLLQYQGEIFKTMTFVEYSASSSSTSSSSTSTVTNGLILIDEVNYTTDTIDVWGDGNFIYSVADGFHIDTDLPLPGLESWTVDGNGFLTGPIDATVSGSKYNSVWGDGNFIYVACSDNGIRSYSVDVSGSFTYIDTDYQGGNYWSVWGDGTYIYVACGLDGLRSYSVDGGGNLTHIDTDDQGGSYISVWGDGNFIYIADPSTGLLSYSVDGGGNLTHIDTHEQGGGNYGNVFADSNFVYVTSGTFVRSYSVNVSGGLTYEDVSPSFANFTDGIWGDGTFIYVVGGGAVGISIFSVDGAGTFTLIDNHWIGYGDYNRVWGDGTYIYVASEGGGIFSYKVRT